MIVSLFKTRQPGMYVFLVLLSIVVFLIAREKSLPVIQSHAAMPLYRLITLCDQKYWLLYSTLTLIIFVLQGIQIHLLISRFEVLYKASFLPWLMYILLMVLVPGLLVFSPAMIANTFILLMFDRLFRIYKCEHAQGYHFEAAAMLSLAVCFYLPAVSFILLLIAAFLILHPFDWRNWVSGLLGFSAPVYLLSVFLLITGKADGFIPDRLNMPFKIHLHLSSNFKVSAFFILILTLLSVLKLRENFYKNNSKTRLFQQVTVIYCFIALLTSLFTPSLPLFRYALVVPGLAVLNGYYMLALRRNWVADSLLILLVTLAILNHFKLPFVH
jgi:hypothetical protein